MMEKASVMLVNGSMFLEFKGVNLVCVCGEQYREPGVLLWRGFSLNEFANQCFTNNLDYGKGRQMPVHYGSSKLNYPTVSSPIA